MSERPTHSVVLGPRSPEGEGFRVIDSFSRIIRLGEGISSTGRISEAAIGRAISALSVCRDKMRHRNAQRLRLIATEACRAASNADAFRDRVATQTGIALEVINRETEASLAVVGFSPLVDPQGTGAILFDIGGGSSELVRIARDYRDADLSEAEVAMMAFAERVSQDAYAMTDDDSRRLREHGFTDREVVDIALAAAARNYYSRAIQALAVEVDVPPEMSPQLREALVGGL